jgi:hypothetical protein
MQHALFIEKLDANPLIVVNSLSIDDDAVDLQGWLQTAMGIHNANVLLGQAEGALVWSDKDAARRYEFRVGDGLREQRFGNSEKLIGFYTCDSGRGYWYYGKSVTWVPGKRTYWEVYVYRHDKKFTYDGIFDSADLLVKLDKDLPRIEIDSWHGIAEHHAKQRIERWDRTQGASQ